MMYEAVKKYETYMACNKRLGGKGTSSSASQQKATGHTSGYKPQFHKTTAFAATIEEAENDVLLKKKLTPKELNHLRKMMRGCSSPAIWRRPYLMIQFCK